ncbi:hypothetical protein LTR37_010456 [Vermiconidia calcicola]|uniref:Uncharacterized protein n=1 Tax=Vermiconidia calcicola TaxID=1690605 RepID=A0ACC3N6P2_9PEZI|nr:hypothetical protein LTR37_010456 [Vermiconidia calcicola]
MNGSPQTKAPAIDPPVRTRPFAITASRTSSVSPSQSPRSVWSQRPNGVPRQQWQTQPSIAPKRTPPTQQPSQPIMRRQQPEGPELQRRAPLHPPQNNRPPKQMAALPIMRQLAPSMNDAEMKLSYRNFPPNASTLDIYQHLEQYGTLARIEIQVPRREDCTNGWVLFCPPPRNVEWIRNGIGIKVGVTLYHVEFTRGERRPTYRLRSPIDYERTFAEETRVSASKLHFGVMDRPGDMLILHSTATSSKASLQVTLNLQRRRLDIDFPATVRSPAGAEVQRLYRMQLSFTQMKEVFKMKEMKTGETALIIPMDTPPEMFRKTENGAETHEHGATLWSDWQLWYRQTDIDRQPYRERKAVTQLQKETPLIDVGRWLTYALIFDKTTSASPAFNEMCQALNHHNVSIREDTTITLSIGDSKLLWAWLDNPTSSLQLASVSGGVSELHQMAEEITDLPFQVWYQLEVCISQGVLHECNIGKPFLEKLAAQEPERAAKLLEKVADEKERFWNPDDIFRRLMHKVSIVAKSRPKYCVMVRAATITPTTIYFLSPVLEISNRVIRQYWQHADRFLRVRFTDEKDKGKIMSPDDASMNEVFTRIKRTMTNGIKVADRHYEFLAFGNSQFREGGAWFFASTGELTAQKIRDWMGNFEHIKVIAKYCARIGQAFSTTRAVQIAVNREDIPDINRNDYCFTDGVGKISPFLAQMIAREHNLPSTNSDYPSVFQFRLGGCKGVLAVDPSVPWNTVQIRPSQEKFKKTDHRGLEICRISQESTAYLNIQLILVLSSIGVEDNFFLRKMSHELSDYREAMTSEKKALEMLNKNIDFNQMTIELQRMVMDGFMHTQDPFMMSVLRLWRSWNIKYLKEKARINVEQGAFVLGCVDETGTLKGNSDDMRYSSGERNDPELLPEIFLQIPDRDPSRKGKWKVVEGVCILARNPSLHPGDVRVVRAVDVPALHHLRSCVALPQTGDRPLANMCSGGDLDGDDYLVMWDDDIIPNVWNHPAMNYDAPDPVQTEGPVTVDDMTSFFVTHLKHANLSRIAVAHRYWADACEAGVKDSICLELASLHSMAVDYSKTGVPAEFPKRLRVSRWPHWAESKNRARSKIYQSKKIIGKLYDMVQRVDFIPAWDLAFDKRILNAYQIGEEPLSAAREAKEHYDEDVCRVMAKFEVKSEFEVWTTFALEHSDDMQDYKFAETLGEAVNALKDNHQKLCYEAAGTSAQERDWEKMGPFVAAMYKVAEEQVAAKLEELSKYKLKGGQWVPVGQPTFGNMPFMSFPWLFPAELGRIANSRTGPRFNSPLAHVVPRKKPPKMHGLNILGGGEVLEPLQEIKMPEQPLGDPEPVRLPIQDDSGEERYGMSPGKASLLPSIATFELESTTPPMVAKDIESRMTTLAQPEEPVLSATEASKTAKIVSAFPTDAAGEAKLIGTTPTVAPVPMPLKSIATSLPSTPSSDQAPATDNHEVDAETQECDAEAGEEVTLALDSRPSALDALESLMSSPSPSAKNSASAQFGPYCPDDGGKQDEDDNEEPGEVVTISFDSKPTGLAALEDLTKANNGEQDGEEEVREEVTLDLDSKPSALDALASLTS